MESDLPMSSTPSGGRPLLVATLSGAAALVYELVFFRELGVLFGVAIHAVAAVVGTFLLGLGIGARWADRLRQGDDPLRAYARIELWVGVFGIVAPFLFRALGWWLTSSRFDRGEAGSFESVAWTLGFAFVLLLPPTILMGATFPLLAAAIGAVSPRSTSRLGAVYGANTFGAAIGALLAAFVLLPYAGKVGTTHVAAALNFLAAFLAFRGASASAHGSPPSRPVGGAAATLGRPEALAAFACGFFAIAFQVLGTRVLACLLAATVYAFAVALAVFLAGTALGGALGAAWWPRSTPTRRAIGCGIALLVLCMACGIEAAQTWAGAGDILFGPRNRKPPSSFSSYVGEALIGSTCLFALATLTSGVVFTLLMRRVAAASTDTTAAIGRMYFSNAVGSTLGALCAGFLFLPLFGIRESFWWLFAAALFVAAAIWLAEPLRSRWSVRIATALVLGVAGAGAAHALRVPAEREIDAGVTTVFAADSPVSSVKVESSTEFTGAEPLLSFVVNGRVEASTTLLDRRLQYLLGFIPALIHQNPRRVLSIALGTGMSTAAVAMTGPERIDLVELSPAVLEASRHFDAYTGRLLDQPIVHVHVDDGRSYLARSADSYDLIMADPVHPSIAGSASLYTREYYAMARDHLAPGGMMSQWIPLYELSTEDIGGIVKTFRSAFPHLTLWVTGYDLVLLGSREPFALDPRAIELRMQREPVRSTLRAIGVRDVADLLGCCFGAGTAAQALADASPREITDNKPWLEFTSPRRLDQYSRDVIALLARSVEEPPFASGTTEGMIERVRTSSRRLRDGAATFVESLRPGNYAAAFAEYEPILFPGN